MLMPKSLEAYPVARGKNLPNSFVKNKKTTLLRRQIVIGGGFKSAVIVAGLFCASGAQAIPTQFAWQVRLNAKNTYGLQVSNDKGFSELAHEAVVKGPKFYNWEAPSEGVYHWRLLRPQTADGAERNTFLSGSFAVIDPSISREQPAVLSWDKVEGADRYKIYVLEGGIKRRIMVTTDNRFFVPQLNVALMLEVVPFKGENKVNPFLHLDPSLNLKSGANGGTIEKISQSPGAPPEEKQLQSPGKYVIEKISQSPGMAEETQEESPEASTEEPQPKPETAKTEPIKTTPEPIETVESVRLSPPSHQVSLYAMMVKEILRAQKLEIDVDSQEQIIGFGARFWLNPVSGLILSGFGQYHEFVSALQREGGDPVDLKQSRISGAFLIGWDFLPRIKEHSLSVSVGGAIIQIPLLPLAFSGSPTAVPRLQKKKYNMPAVAVRYDFFHSSFAVHVGAGAAKMDNEDVNFSWQNFSLQYFVTDIISADLGVFNHLSQSVSCHKSKAVCLVEGKVATTSKELGVTLGLGASM